MVINSIGSSKFELSSMAAIQELFESNKSLQFGRVFSEEADSNIIWRKAGQGLSMMAAEELDRLDLDEFSRRIMGL
jgi:hypothetical protein